MSEYKSAVALLRENGFDEQADLLDVIGKAESFDVAITSQHADTIQGSILFEVFRCDPSVDYEAIRLKFRKWAHRMVQRGLCYSYRICRDKLT